VQDSERLKLLFAVGSIDPQLGGSVEAARVLAAGCQEEGHHVEVLAAQTPRPEWIAAWSCEVHGCGYAPTLFRFAPKLTPWVKCNAARFDCVIVNGIWSWLGIGMRRGLRNTGTPYMTFTHGMLDPWHRRNSGFKHVKKTLYWNLFERRNLARARAVLFTCGQERVASRLWFGAREPESFIAPLGIDGVPARERQQTLAFETAFPGLATVRYLLFLGRIAPQKGCGLLLQAFAQLADQDPSLHLVMAGPGSGAYPENMRKMASPASRVHWIGHLDGDVKWGAFRCAEAFVLTSHMENFGISVAEALSCGKPVLITYAVAIWREIHGAQAGYVEKDDVEGAVRLLRRWIETPQPVRDRMGRNALACHREKFEYRAAARELIRVIGLCVYGEPARR
jgi:glycosyltransferase involved in cell wall biosynthesis